MPKHSQYVLIVDNVSSVTSSRDIRREFDFAGRINDVIRDVKYRCALVEFEKAADARYAWKKMDGVRVNGRDWKVDYATKEDFKFFGWKWFEYTPSPSRSRSRSRSASRSRSPDTPRNNEGRRSASKAPSGARD